ncbi:unnamed protein product [Prunus armeniaca]
MSVLDWTVNNFNCSASALWEAFERAELLLLQSEGAEVAGLEDSMSWNCTVKFVEVFIFVKTQALLVLGFC